MVVDGCFADGEYRPLDTPLELIDFLSGNPNLVGLISGPQDGGWHIRDTQSRFPPPGSRTLASARPSSSNPSLTDRLGIPIVKSAGNDYWVDGDHVVSVISLPVRGHTLAIFVESPPENTLTFQAAAADIIATVAFPEN